MAEASGTLPAPGDITAALDRVLARPEFNPPPETALDRLRQWLTEQWNAWWDALRKLLFEGIGDVVTTSWVIETIVIALVVALLVVLVRRLPRRTRRAGDVDVVPPAADDATAGARAQLAAAAAAAAAGRFLEAAHALYLGAVLWLAAAGHLRFDDATTGEEYARALPRAGFGGPFRALLATFYPLAFGDRPATTEAYARMRAAATAMGVPE
jgi:hypothetical protein